MGNSLTKSLSSVPDPSPSSAVVRQFHNSVMVGLTDGSAPHVVPPATMKPRPFIFNVHANEFFGTSPSSSQNTQNNHVVLIKAARLSTYFLDLSHLNLSDLCGSSMRQAHHLRGLQLSFNKLSSLPLELGTIHNLCFLDLSSNQLTSLPDTICDLTSLIELKMARNLLTSLPPDLFAKLTKLETLDLSHNQIATLPQKISELSSLSSLHLDGNPLSSVPYELGQLKFLRTLTLEGCPLLEDLPENLAAIMESAAATPTSGSAPAPAAAKTPLPAPAPARVPSLKELAARVLVRHSVPVPSKSIPPEVAGYLKTAQACSFCQGPFFEFHVKRYRFVFRGGVNLPLESRLCSTHWTNEKERILAMFRPAPSTSPKALDAHKLQLIESRNSRQASSRRSIAVSISSTDLGVKPSRKASLFTRAGNMMKGKSPNTMTAASENALSSSGTLKRGPATEGSPSSERNPSQRPDSPMEIEDDRIRTMKASNSSLF